MDKSKLFLLPYSVSHIIIEEIIEKNNLITWIFLQCVFAFFSSNLRFVVKPLFLTCLCLTVKDAERATDGKGRLFEQWDYTGQRLTPLGDVVVGQALAFRRVTSPVCLTWLTGKSSKGQLTKNSKLNLLSHLHFDVSLCKQFCFCCRNVRKSVTVPAQTSKITFVNSLFGDFQQELLTVEFVDDPE